MIVGIVALRTRWVNEFIMYEIRNVGWHNFLRALMEDKRWRVKENAEQMHPDRLKILKQIFHHGDDTSGRILD